VRARSPAAETSAGSEGELIATSRFNGAVTRERLLA
jgi:hypothetical protein